jgi:hypothetical protein
MASGFAHSPASAAGRDAALRPWPGLRRRIGSALVAALVLAHPAAAQDRGGPGAGGMAAGGQGGDAVSLGADAPGGPRGGEGALPSLDAVGVTVLGEPASQGGPDAEPPQADAPRDDSLGLIEAPDGMPAIGAGGLPFIEGDLFPDSPAVAAFAQRPTAQARAGLGPISHPPVVVELFTSQGCTACPPADRMLADLAERDDILALSWHVDYWDYLGWADDFAKPEFTLRQQSYAHAWGERAIYTPQMIVGGTDTLIALRPADLMALVDMQMTRPVPIMVSARQRGEEFQIELTPRVAIPDKVAIVLVRYAPHRHVTIKAGENRGVAVRYTNVVLAADRIGEWDGRAALRMTVRPDLASGDAFPEDTRHAILAQQMGRAGQPTGPILAAIRLD